MMSKHIGMLSSCPMPCLLPPRLKMAFSEPTFLIPHSPTPSSRRNSMFSQKSLIHSAIVRLSLLCLAGPLSGAVASDHQAQIEWFRGARFGMFIHWGVYAVSAGEWKGRQVPGLSEWIMEGASIPVAEYKDLAKGFTASRYDPKAWAALAKEAGMNYVVITAKHHDGFALYDSAVSDWDVTGASPAGQDLLKPLADAVRAQGIKFGCYYSQSLDWVHPGGGKWRGPEGKGWDRAQWGDFNTFLREVSLPQLKEVIERYQPDILWFDMARGMSKERLVPFVDLLAQNPRIVVNDRLGTGWKGDMLTVERHVPPHLPPNRMVEVCMSIHDGWGYSKNTKDWKSTGALLRDLSDVASKGGNLLLNVGPTAEGVIPPESVERLRAMGAWLSVNGEAIYNTSAGPFPRRLPWGRVTQTTRPDGGVTLFLHIWTWPDDGSILLPGIDQKPTSGRLLATGKRVKGTITPEGLSIALPKQAPDAEISVVRVDFRGAITVKQPETATVDKDGHFVLRPVDADPQGDPWGVMRLSSGKADAYYTGWSNAAWYLEYPLTTPAAQRWAIRAEVAVDRPVNVVVQAGSQSTKAAIAATGGPTTWQTVELGHIDLPQGKVFLQIKGNRNGWSALNLRAVTLTPVPPGDVLSNETVTAPSKPER